MLKMIFRAELNRWLPLKFKATLLVVGPGASNTAVCAVPRTCFLKIGAQIVTSQLWESSESRGTLTGVSGVQH